MIADNRGVSTVDPAQAGAPGARPQGQFRRPRRRCPRPRLWHIPLRRR